MVNVNYLGSATPGQFNEKRIGGVTSPAGVGDASEVSVSAHIILTKTHDYKLFEFG